MLITTANDLPGYEITETLGEVFGLTVRSRNVGSQLGAGLKSLMGGELKGMTKALVDSRRTGDRADGRGSRRRRAPTRSSRCASTPPRWDRTGPRSARTAPPSRCARADRCPRGRLRPLEHDRRLAGRRSGRRRGREVAEQLGLTIEEFDVALVRRPRPAARDGADRGRARALRPLAGGRRAR